jgi:hypothetical protein
VPVVVVVVVAVAPVVRRVLPPDQARRRGHLGRVLGLPHLGAGVRGRAAVASVPWAAEDVGAEVGGGR